MKRLVIAVLLTASASLLFCQPLLWFEIVGVGMVANALSALASHAYDRHQQRKLERSKLAPAKVVN
jgi:hypothetical protein